MITQEYLKSILRYDADTGNFYWLRSTNSRRKVGDLAGRINNLGYVQIHIDRKAFYAHRLAWLYVYGRLPAKFLDHVDRNRSNNRLDNLREASHAQNIANSGKYRNNSSGAKGVIPYHGKWRAQIASKSLGSFNTIEEARAAYVVAARERYGDFACES